MDFGKSKKYLSLSIAFLATFLVTFSFFPAFAEEEEEVSDASEFDVFDQKKQRIAGILDSAFQQDTIYAHVDGDAVVIDVSNELEAIQNLYTQDTFTVAWNLTKYNDLIDTPRFEVDFSQVGHRGLRFTLSQASETGDIVVYTKDIDVSIYARSIPMVSFVGEDHRIYEKFFESGVLLYPLYLSDGSETIEKGVNLYDAYTQYFRSVSGEKSDYILIAGGRDDVVDTVHNIHNSIIADNKDGAIQSLPFLVLTSDNLERAADVGQIFLTGKSNIGRIRFASIDDSYQPILRNVMYADVVSDFEGRGFDTIEIVSLGEAIPEYMFISRFANALTNTGMDRENIFILFLIPYLLTGVVFFRHFLGFAGIGILLPVFLVYLSLIQTWYIGILLYILFFAINVLVSQFFRGYAMLYAPRIAFNISWNIVVFILIWNVAQFFDIQIFSLQDPLAYIIFFFLLERTIALIWSKDLGEYLPSFFNTILFVLIAYFLVSLSFVSQFILGYPELIILLIPINFFFGRYRGLRLTEYFRFREILGKEFEEE